MSNVINHNFHNLRLKANKDEYWDFFINKDAIEGFEFSDDEMDDKCLISFIDACLDECILQNGVQSVEAYKWESAVTKPYDLLDAGYTGYDNGLFHYFRDRIGNKDFVEKYTNTPYHIEEDARLKLHAVSGTTRLYDYPIHIEQCDIKLNGGFLQGFFMTECDKYAVLPYYMDSGDEWNLEFVLKKEEFEKESEKTLNDKYPNNKGIFFYLGTRAENKWAYLYDDSVDECFAIGMDDYVDGGEIDLKKYRITNFLDPNPSDFVTREHIEEELALDDYLDYKYYEPKAYGDVRLSEDDFMLGDYVLLYDEKAKTIDEEHTPHEEIEWCCHYSVEKKVQNKRRICCSCSGCRSVLGEWTTVKEIKGGFYSSCNLFGDDYIGDFGGLDYDTDFIEPELDISDFEYSTKENSFKLEESGQYYIDTDNKFLMFDRTCDGFNVHNYVSDSFMRYCGRKNNFTGNLFLLMNRTCTGYTVHNIDKLRDSYKKDYNIYKDIYDNALAFRITDDGAIGYRYYTVDCESETQTGVREGYSYDGVIKENEWYVINVKINAHFDTMSLRFYVNGKLVFVTDEMRKINLRKLDEVYEKQETVPFNISLGGGTQGLAETVLPNYMLDPYKVFPLEENFGGSFIGHIRSFKFYNCFKEYLRIYNNFKYVRKKIM